VEQKHFLDKLQLLSPVQFIRIYRGQLISSDS